MPDMLQRLGMTFILLLGLDSLAMAALACVSEMMACSREMKQGLKSIKNRSSLCGLMHDYYSCIQTSCNETLTPCDLSEARQLIDDALDNYNIECEFNVYENTCNLAGLISTTSPLLLVLNICCVWGMVYARFWRH